MGIKKRLFSTEKKEKNVQTYHFIEICYLCKGASITGITILTSVSTCSNFLKI